MATDAAMMMLSLGLPKMAMLFPIHVAAIVDVGVAMMASLADVAPS